jgi:2-keto-4-pentenoate hydratase/2-oxohepta-3-ene-1,7-dioic acid hydratase in catechol pathway
MVTLPIQGTDQKYDLSPTKIIALGLNYREHIAESHSVNVQGFTQEVPAEPVLFPKTPNVLIGPGEPIVLPRIVSEYDFDEPRTDYEAELAFIIKEKCRNVPADQAMEKIMGFTCFNDVSQRNIQTGDRAGWFRGKSFDSFGPIGPVIVPAEKIGDPQNLGIVCRLNGNTVQESNTNRMIFTIEQILSFVSKNFTLMPGDIISTGTPSGVGSIKEGDVVEIEIERIGILSNPVTLED